MESKTTDSMPKIKPLSGYALIEPLEMEKKTAAGIVLPESHDEKSQKGKVIAVGKSIYKEGQEIIPEFKVNDTVVYKKWGGDEVKFGTSGKEYIFVKFEDILAIID